VGFTWEGAPQGAVQVRARTGAGDAWGDWYDVHASPDEGPDGAGATAEGAGRITT